jgi:hypothetical protein
MNGMIEEDYRIFTGNHKSYPLEMPFKLIKYKKELDR